MVLQIENLGPIKNAKIDLSQPITLFCGENNTGKTYIAYLIYALLDRNIGFGDIIIPDGLFDSVKKSKSAELEYTPLLFTQYKERVLSNLKSRIEAIYGISTEERNKLFKGVKLFIDKDKNSSDHIKQIKFKYTISFGKTSYKVIKESGSFFVKIEPQKDSVANETGIFSLLLNNSIYRALLFGRISNAVFFPVERNAIYTFNRELLLSRSKLIDKIQDSSLIDFSNLIEENSKRYPSAIRANINHASDIYTLSKNKSEFYIFAEEIEKQLLDGTLSITKEGDVFFQSNKSGKNNGSIPVHAASSLVKTLAPFVFYLRYEAQKDDLIIIDEPEMNLHPSSQVLLTRFFIRMQKQGLRLLISTHSDYIIREFNKYILMGSLLKNKKKLPKNSLADDTLNYNEVKVHTFAPATSRSSKISVTPIVVDEDGFAIPTIDNTIKQQNEETEDLYFKLHY